MGEQTCSSCGRNWDAGLPSFKVLQWCATCEAEKRRRMNLAALGHLGELVRANSRFQQEWARLTSEEREARAEKDKELWR